MKGIQFKNVLVIGLGEIGSPLFEIVRETYNTQGLDIKPKKIRKPIDLMHICYPYDQKFVQSTIDYIKKFEPKLTIIESTVLPFTTNKIYEQTKSPICHSPVRGRQADGFKWAYLTYTKFIGPVKPEYGIVANKYYNSLGFRSCVCHSPLETEFMKILNTTYYGLMIAWFQEIHRICLKFGLKEKEIINFFKTNEEESNGKHPRPIFYPGVIEGHCVIPNAKLLNEIFPSAFVRAILQSNEKRKKEV